MKKTIQTLTDADEEMDILPLKYISSDHDNYRSIKDLRRYSIHDCEFCEERFENSYNYLIHNAKHIIIPLIKMLPYHCDQCGWYYISEEELNDHIIHVHKSSVMSKAYNDDCKITASDKCNFVAADIKGDSDEDERQSLIKRKENNVTENILQNFVMNCKVDIEKFVPPWLHDSDEKDDKSCNIVNIYENSFKNNVAKFSLSNKVNNIDESDVINCRNNIVKLESSQEENSKVKNNVTNLNNPAATSDSTSELSDVDDDPIVMLAPVNKEVITEYNSQYNSIHFDDLIKPGIFYCKRCYKRFPNKFEVIVHERVHLNLSTSLKPLKVMHNQQPGSAVHRNVPEPVKTCERCHEEVTDTITHGQICFRLYCSACSEGFNSRTALAAHEDKCKGETLVNMCDNCLHWRERPKHIQYNSIERLTNVKVKQVCHWCGKLCYDISVVTVGSRPRLADRIHFESDLREQNFMIPNIGRIRKINKPIAQQSKSDLRKGRGSKALSNQERLKLIQNRLKLMKK